MRKIGFGVAVAGLMLAGCHLITEDLPTEPSKTPAKGVLTIPIPVIPGATPTPSPTAKPKPTPTPTPEPSPTPPSGSGCGKPLPPEISRINAKVHIRGPRWWTLDSTPLVGPDRDYCREIGFTDGRSFCPVRPEGNPERVACEALRTGIAKDTGRPGPTWTRNGQYCTGEATGCYNTDENQYQLWAVLGGHYEACARNGVCGSVDVDR
jgi:hypothetical protein